MPRRHKPRPYLRIRQAARRTTVTVYPRGPRRGTVHDQYSTWTVTCTLCSTKLTGFGHRMAVALADDHRRTCPQLAANHVCS